MEKRGSAARGHPDLFKALGGSAFYMENNEIIRTVLAYASGLMGMGYSQRHRYRLYTGGSADCSSFVFAAFLSAGIVLKTHGRENRVSCRQVYSEGFDLLFPDRLSVVGKNGYWAPKGFYREFDWHPGDIIFYCNDMNTRRRNRITHVAVCMDGEHIIHDGNNAEKVCIKNISYGDGRITAVIRLKDNAVPRACGILKRSSAFGTDIMRMQLLLNAGLPEAKLNCLGFMTRKTADALVGFRLSIGMTNKAVCDEAVWQKLLDKTRKHMKQSSDFGS